MIDKTTKLLSSNWIVAILILFTLLIFIRGITPSFSADDYPHLLKNTHQRGILDAFSVFLELDGREYRPIVRFSLWANYQMGDTAVPFHLTNILLHLVNILFLYFLMYELSQSKLHALVGSALFALHPIHSTNINFIMGRTDILCSTFFLPSLIFFIRSIDQKMLSVNRLISMFFFVFALLSKEMAVSLPVILFVAFCLIDTSGYPKRLLLALKRIFPFLLIDCFYIMIRIVLWMKNPQTVSVYTNYSPTHLINNLLQWAFGLLFPFELYRLKDLMTSNLLGFVIISSVLAFSLSTTFIYLFWKERKEGLNQRLLLFSFFWFLITLIPISGGNPHRWYLYIPSLSISFFAISALHNFDDRKRSIIFSSFICITLCAYSFEAARQTEVWSEQSRISQSFLQQIKENDLHKVNTFYFANVPFGYKSAFLFTFNSLQDAIYFHYGHKPKLHILSFVNLKDSLNLITNISSGRISFSLKPDHYGFFIFPPLKREFVSGDKRIQLHGFEIYIGPINYARKVTHYDILIPETLSFPVFYFDGDKIYKY